VKTLRLVTSIVASELVLGLAASGAFAADCPRIESDAERLKCYDAASGRVPPQTATPAAPVPDAVTEEKPGWLLQHLKVRDVLSGSKKGAALSVTRENSDTTYALRAAALLGIGNQFLPESAHLAGWAWDVGAQIAKSTSPSKPVDGRLLALAARGTLFGDSPVILNSALGLEAVWDRVERSRDIGLRYASTVVLEEKILERGVPYSRAGSSHFIFPAFGLHIDRHSDDAGSGRLFGGHVGLRASYYPGRALWPIHLFADALRAKDFASAGGATKRSSTQYNFGIEYAFIDPTKNERSAVVPTLSLRRTIGSNFLTGEADAAKTVLALTLLVN
jgi:hypothetical protein